MFAPMVRRLALRPLRLQTAKQQIQNVLAALHKEIGRPVSSGRIMLTRSRAMKGKRTGRRSRGSLDRDCQGERRLESGRLEKSCGNWQLSRPLILQWSRKNLAECLGTGDSSHIIRRGR